MTYFQAENPHLRIFTVYLLRDPRATLADIKVFKRFYILFDQQVARTCEECVCFVAGVFPRWKSVIFQTSGKFRERGGGPVKVYSNSSYKTVRDLVVQLLNNFNDTFVIRVIAQNIDQSQCHPKRHYWCHQKHLLSGDPGPLHPRLRSSWTSLRFIAVSITTLKCLQDHVIQKQVKFRSTPKLTFNQTDCW